MAQLVKITEHGLVTLDSQPGVLVDSYGSGGSVDDDDDEPNSTLYIQKPHLTLAGPQDTIREIVEAICRKDTYKHLRIVSGTYIPLPLRDYTSFDKDDCTTYVSVCIGVPDHFDKVKGVDQEYLDYVLSNKFFDEIVELVSSTISN